ncbi:MaoC family dehydratase [Desulfobacterium sp. N47]
MAYKNAKNKFGKIRIGATESFTKTIGEADLTLFCGISGDFNPLHVDDLYASKTLFRGRVAHGMLVASFISNVLGTKLPGPGTIFLSQNIKFLTPVYIGDTITAIVEIVSKDPQKRHIVLRTFCINQKGVNVIDGEAQVLFDPDNIFVKK